MKSKIISILTIITTISCFFFIPVTRAETLEEKKTETQEKREEAEQKLQYVENELSIKLVKIQEMDDKIREAELQIQQMDKELVELAEKVSETESNLKLVQENYIKNKNLMEKRLAYMYETGEYSYLDLLLQSSTLIEFLSNYYMLQQIVQSDNDTLKLIGQEKNEIENKKEQLSREKSQLKLLKVKQEQTRIIMQNNKTVQQKEIEQLNEDEKKLQEKIQEYKDEETRLELAIEQALNYEYIGEYTGGVMLWPIAKSGTYITSNYSVRTHPIQGILKFHTGIDIGNAGFGAPVVAAADGVVVMASYYGGYGNCVMINHGNGISTLYGHGQQILTTVGTEVKKGDLIMEVGSTGVSTGPHLHFEVRVNGNHTNPLPYLLGTNTTNVEVEDSNNTNTNSIN